MPFYIFEDFRKACGSKVQIVVPMQAAQDSADRDFGLKTQKAILSFIFNGGLENLDFVNTKLWENNPNPSLPINVDAYEFTSVSKLGYIAFFYNGRTSRWVIKSFHLSANMNPIMKIAFKRAGLIKDKESGLGEKDV